MDEDSKTVDIHLPAVETDKDGKKVIRVFSPIQRGPNDPPIPPAIRPRSANEERKGDEVWRELKPDELPDVVRNQLPYIEKTYGQKDIKITAPPHTLEAITTGGAIIYQTRRTLTIYERIEGKWWMVTRQEPNPEFYKESGALARNIYPPERWQLSLFDNPQAGTPAVTETRVDFKALDLNVMERRFIMALEKGYERRKWDEAHGAGWTERHGGVFGLSGKVPNILMPNTEILDNAGCRKWTDKNGKTRYSSREREALIGKGGAASTLLRTIHRLRIERTREDGTIQVIDHEEPLLHGVTWEWIARDRKELRICREGRRSARVNALLIEPNALIFFGIKEHSRLLLGSRADYVLKPWTLWEDLLPFSKDKQGRTSNNALDENVRFVEWGLKTLAERHTPGKPRNWIVTRDDYELARALGMYGRIKSRDWKRIRESIDARAAAAKGAGYLLTWSREDRTDGRRYYRLHFNPKRCTYQKRKETDAEE